MKTILFTITLFYSYITFAQEDKIREVYRKSKSLIAEKKYQEGIDVLSIVHDSIVKFPDLAFISYSNSDTLSAIKKQSECLAILLYERGLAYLGLKNYVKAETDFTAAINAYSFHLNSYQYRYSARLMQKNYKLALEDKNHLISIEPDNYKNYYDRSNLKRYQNDQKGALVDLNLCIQLVEKIEIDFLQRGDEFVKYYIERVKIKNNLQKQIEGCKDIVYLANFKNCTDAQKAEIQTLRSKCK